LPIVSTRRSAMASTSSSVRVRDMDFFLPGCTGLWESGDFDCHLIGRFPVLEVYARSNKRRLNQIRETQRAEHGPVPSWL
jgi:hypothetical protein